MSLPVTPTTSTPVDVSPSGVRKASSIEPVISVRGLTVTERATGKPIVRGLDLDVFPGETVGLVGESGCGKTTSVLGLLGLLDPVGLEVTGSALFMGIDMVAAPDRVRRQHWGKDIGVIYQDALRALNPVMRVGKQIEEVFESHGGHPDVGARVTELLTEVGIADPDLRRRSYPHELSGGMRQRVMAAIAVAMSPRLLVADEPTTALDVTIQAQVLDLIRDLSSGSDTATIIVSHDLGVIAGMCDRVVVLYAGSVAEQGGTEAVFKNPGHPYTRALLRSSPGRPDSGPGRFEFIPGRPPTPSAQAVGCAFAERCDLALDICVTTVPPLESIGPGQQAACFNPDGTAKPSVAAKALASLKAASLVDGGNNAGHPGPLGEVDLGAGVARSGPGEVLLRAENLKRWYGGSGIFNRGRQPVRAVDGISLSVSAGQCLGLVGESGSGKTTLGRLLVGLEPATSGEIYYDESDITQLSRAGLRAFRRQAQMIYQEPRSSLNRKYTVGSILQTAFRAGGETKSLGTKVAQILDRVGLGAEYAQRYPTALSGGECQRVAIARALSVRPRIIVADEAVSSLDVSIQGQILNLLADIQSESNIGIVFIAHDLAVVRELCDTVAVMYLGRIVEQGAAKDVLVEPAHPYSMALRSAAPIADPVVERTRSRIVLVGDPPSPAAPPSGCTFHTRCPVGPTMEAGREICRTTYPPLIGGEHRTACHFTGSAVNLTLRGVEMTS